MKMESATRSGAGGFAGRSLSRREPRLDIGGPPANGVFGQPHLRRKPALLHQRVDRRATESKQARQLGDAKNLQPGDSGRRELRRYGGFLHRGMLLQRASPLRMRR